MGRQMKIKLLIRSKISPTNSSRNKRRPMLRKREQVTICRIKIEYSKVIYSYRLTKKPAPQCEEYDSIISL